MSTIKIIDKGEKFTHAQIDNFSHFEGKEFLKDATEATSCEISLGTLPQGAAVPFFHNHKENEENYIIISGSGKFQIDTEVFDISAGSVIRVATGCDRNLKCTSQEPMTYLCIQAKENSLGNYTMTDGTITERPSLL
ncbi:MAG: cupin domain-containing protein [Bacteroidales bacterium]|nr:cupin domain-containing protein [Bacteroidales bacterium]